MDLYVILKALADKTRLRIIELLLKHDYCVRALSREIGLSESAISQHLKVLREAGILVGEKKGYYMHYKVDRESLHKCASMIEDLAKIDHD